MTLSDLYKCSWFANASYVVWSLETAANVETQRSEADNAHRIPFELGNDIFVNGNWRIPSWYDNDDAGFAANVFSDGTESILAIRGTEIDTSLLPPGLGDQTALDLLNSDLREIGFTGLAISQCVSLFNYIQCLQADTSNGHVLQLALDSETVVTGAEAPTDLPYLKVQDSSPVPALPGTETYYWLVPTYNGQGLGVIAPGEHLTVTGHSLGGHLAALAIRLFPDVFSQAVTFNAPGFDPVTSGALTDDFVSLFSNFLSHPPASSFTDIANRIVRVESEDSAPGDDISVVSSLFTGVPAGIATVVRTENDSHSMDQIMDALAVMDLVQTISPRTSVDEIVQIYDATSARGGDTEEGFLAALSMLFLRDPVSLPVVEAGMISHGDFAARSALHERILDLLAAAEGKQYSLVSLVNLSSAELVTLAESSAAYCYALQQLSPFAVLGDESLYEGLANEGALDFASFSRDYWEARAEFLSLKAESYALDDEHLPGVGQSRTYIDEASGMEVNIQGSVGGSAGSNHIVFGGSAVGLVDVVEGASGDDVVFGGLGSDLLVGHGGADVLEGGQGDDALFGNDHLNAHFDDFAPDHLYGGIGVDSYYLGDGDIVLDSDRTVGALVFQGTSVSGPFTKVAQGIYEQAPGGVRLLQDGNTATFVLDLEYGAGCFEIADFWGPGGQFQNGDFGISLLDEGGEPDFSVQGVILGTEHADRVPTDGEDFEPLNGSLESDKVLGLGGGDLIQVFEGPDEVDGGPGSDYISSVELLPDSIGEGDFLIGGAGSDVLIGSRGDDRLFGGDDGDFLQGRSGDDLEYGGNGDDWLYGGNGADELIGGDGHDLLVGDVQAYPYFNPFWREGGADVSVSDFRISRRYMFAPSDEPVPGGDILMGGNGDDILLGQYGDDRLSGGPGRDYLIGGTGNDVLEGGDGDDLLSGGSSEAFDDERDDDVMHGGSGNDSMGGQYGNDSLSGDAGNDRLSGGFGSDNLFGGSGNDLLTGENGNDLLSGDGGDDTLYGGVGNDELKGGPGSDVFLFGRGGGRDVISESVAGDPANIDTIVLYGDIAPWDVVLASSGRDLVISIPDSGDSIAVASWVGHEDQVLDRIQFGEGLVWDVAAIRAVLAGTGTETTDYFIGTSGDDQFDGFGADDLLYGFSGDDRIAGDGGDDLIDGGEGNDALSGGEGDDMLYGGPGDDVLDSGSAAVYGDVALGGQGSDVYRFDLEYDGVHFIREETGQWGDVDVIRFGAGIGAEDLRIGRSSDRSYPEGSLLVDIVPRAMLGRANIVIAGWFGDDAGQIERFEFQDGTSMSLEDIEGRIDHASEGHDYLTGTTANDVIHGLGGDDQMSSNGESGCLYGDDGDDWMFAGAVLNSMMGGPGNDAMYVVPHFDPYGNTPDQISVVHGNAGNDTLIAKAGGMHSAALLDGGEGGDSIAIRDGLRSIVIGGTGNDVIDLNADSGATLALYNAGDGTDRITFNYSGTFAPATNPQAAIPEFAISFGGVGVADIAFQRQGVDLLIGCGADDALVLSDWFAPDTGARPDNALLQIITQGSGHYVPGSADLLNNKRVHVFDLDRLVSIFVASSPEGGSGTRWSIAGGASDALVTASDDAALGGQIAYEFGLLGSVSGIVGEAQRNILVEADSPVLAQNIEAIRTAPTVAAPIQDVETWEDAPLSLDLPAELFADPLTSDQLQIRVSLHGGSPLPNWLNYNDETGTLSGAPQNADVGELRIAVEATNRLGESVMDEFSLTVLNTNDVPHFLLTVPESSFQRGDDVHLDLPPDAVFDPDIGDSLRFAARLVGGGSLPDWLTFDAQHLTFSGHIPSNASDRYDIELVATDQAGATAECEWSLMIRVPDGVPSEPSILGTAGNDRIQGTFGDDIVMSGDGNDFVDGGRGNDVIFGGRGNDTVMGAGGQDRIDGGDGDDELNGGSGDDTITGSLGADTINGGGGYDSLTGAAGNDILFGGLGNDVLSGGAGRDIVDGGSGDDLYVFGVGDGIDSIRDPSGRDVLRFGTGIDPEDILFLHHGSDLIVRFRNEPSSITITKWFQSKTRHIERFEFEGGQVLRDTQIQLLVHAMAVFGPVLSSPEQFGLMVPGGEESPVFSAGAMMQIAHRTDSGNVLSAPEHWRPTH